ncbi:MAG TPA: sulfatase-like hydrolase/transferase [Candidatus Hydrogenedentes bacterium]|nr:sulfatase-like hydrolase/transferase [Candidatus Hydrogenedentota bacterium]
MNRNVLLIIADEFRADCLSALGHPMVKTPNLDALARDGVLFTKCFVQAAPCGPSRMSIYTGRYMCSHQSLDNKTPLAEADDTLGMHLRRHGHAPGIMGYNDYAYDPRILPEGHPNKTSLNYDNFLPGFDVVLFHEYDSPEWYAGLIKKGYPEALCHRNTMYYPEEPEEGFGEHLGCIHPARYRAEDSEAQFLTSTAIDFATLRKDAGWFLSLNYVKPHGPYICPAPYHEMYDPKEVPLPVRRPEELTNPLPYFARIGQYAQDQLMKEYEWRELRACYYGMITELDACLGRLFQFLKDTGQWDSTLIIFTSDHGSYMGDHYMQGKSHFYDSAMRVPYIVRDPSPEADATRGTKVDDFIESIDIAPTVCEFLGVPRHERFQGHSVLGYTRGTQNTPLRNRIFHEFFYYSLLKPEIRDVTNPDACRSWTVRDNHFKYVQFGEETLPPLLFDLQNDPGEFDNLAQKPEYAAVVAEYCQHLIRWRIKHEDIRMERWALQYR